MTHLHPTTSSRRMGRPLPPPDLLYLAPHGLHLRVQTPRGPLPLYRFAPLQMALLTGETVTTAASWPEHLKAFLYQYVPLPTLAPSPQTLPGAVHAQARDPYGLRTWDHTTYQGWPLYLYAHDHPGQPPGGEVPHLFTQIRLDQPPLPGFHQRPQGP